MAKPKRSPKSVRKPLARKKPGKTPLPQGVPFLSATDTIQPETHLLLLLGLLLVAAVFIQYPAFQWLGIFIHLPSNHIDFLLYLAAFLLFLGFRGLPNRSTGPDVSRWAAYPVLLALLGVTMFLRFYRADQPMGRYWDDPAICIIDPCNIVELHIFRIDFAIGHREPFFPYVCAGIWWLLPQLKGLVVERLTSALYDVAAVWVFYRLGREVTGKRLVGLILAALGAVSKPMVLQNLGGMPGLTLPLMIASVIWFQLRLIRKPDLSHFLQWGLLLGFGFYSYIAYRPWVLFLAFTALVWLLWDYKDEAKQPSPKVTPGIPGGLHWALRVLAGLGVLGAFLFVLDRMFVVFYDNPISKIWRMNVWVWLAIQAVLFGSLGYFYRLARGREKIAVGWALGVLLTGFLVYPLAMNAEIGIKIQDNRIHFQNFKQVTDQLYLWIRDLFITGDDRSDMNVEGDPFFDYHAAVLAFAGLIFALARPTKTKFFLALCIFVGSVGHIMTVDPTSAKVLGALPAFLLLSSWGLGSWLTASYNGSWAKKGMGVVLSLGLASFLAWEGYGTFQRVYIKWWNLFRPDILVSNEISAQLPTKRVYMGIYNGMGFASPAVEGVIHDGEPLYLLDKTNVIDVVPGEPRKDLSVIIAALDREWAPMLKKDFPKAQWIPKWEWYQSPTDPPCVFDVVIPAGEVPEKPGKLFQYRVVPDKKWLRRVYVTYYGLGRGMIQYEDSSPTLNPLPAGLGAHSASAEGTWEAPQDGHYIFSVNTPNPIQVWIDGKKVLSSIHSESSKVNVESSTAYLTKGVHLVRVLTYMRVDAWFDRISIQGPGPTDRSLLGE